ncbi:YxiJ family protein [Priestia aryabhattai]|uniref:YxiJ family protein n=1 Tax=Priestia aryabhattai TaxID=412384 RepID=UPI002882B1CC|nr:YxiJ family protein [Priestia aryabhattai]MDT0147695.1 YxiJ family protein [Priestia aryabhattai]MDT0154438.1 YxiJ family protein [Priestia aryabhattai]
MDELKKLNNDLYHPFPHEDIRKIQDKFSEKLHEDDLLTADFNSYWMNIAGSLSYMLKGKTKKIPPNQIDELKLTFFEVFPQYSFLEEEIFTYLNLCEEYKVYEKTRELMLRFLFN